jgi:hypothetical protein
VKRHRARRVYGELLQQSLAHVCVRCSGEVDLAETDENGNENENENENGKGRQDS